ncbi:MAG: flavodoxin family protein [Promethearchaeota archaeon]
MKILGLIGSARKRGNGEVLVKEALIASRERGAEVRAIRLSDYKLLPCKGCLACVLKGEACRLDDDMHSLWGQLQWAEGLVLSAPTYFLGAAGIIKLLIDRLFEYSFVLGQMKRRPAGLIVTAGLHDWDPLSMPMLTILAGTLQLDIIDKMTAYRPGPAEVLLDEATLARAATLGHALVERSAEQEPILWKPEEPRHCPQCGTPFIQFIEKDFVECALCLARGRLYFQGDAIAIEWDKARGQNRWSTEALAEHFSKWVVKTGPVFLKHRKRLQTLLKRYDTVSIEPPPR